MRWTASRTFALLVSVILLALLVAIASLWIGSSGFTWPDDPEILKARAQRVSLAFVVGAALACAGAVFQAVLRNPLADPYLLGVSSGASLGVFCWKVPAIAILLSFLPGGQTVFALVGAMTTTAIVLGLVSMRRRTDPATIILIGVMVSTVVAALLLVMYQFVKSLPGSGYFQNLMVGELQSNLSGGQLYFVSLITASLIVCFLQRPRTLDLLMFSDDEAQVMGLKVQSTRIALLILASILTGLAVSVSGPIGFVGLIAPHAARRIVGVNHARLIPIATLFGAMLLTIADAATRGLASVGVVNTILPVGAITSLIGGPLFIALLMRRASRRQT